MTPEQEAAAEAMAAWVVRHSVITSERTGDVVTWTFTPATPFPAAPQETPHVGIFLDDGRFVSVFDLPKQRR